MTSYTKRDIEVLIPLQKVTILFCRKENTTLSSMQLFLIEAIEEGYTIDQICEATLLSSYVIEAELNQLQSQKLVDVNDTEHKAYVLTDQARNIRLVEKCIGELNAENKTICINMITGDIEPEGGEPESDLMRLPPKLTEQDISGIGIEGNWDFLTSYMSGLSNLTEAELECVRNSVYIEFGALNRENRTFRKCLLSKIPCCLGEESQNAVIPYGDRLSVSSEVNVIYFNFSCSLLEEYATIADAFKQVAEYDSELLSEKGKRVLTLREEFNRLKSCKICCVFDCISGQYDFVQNPPHNLEKTQKRIRIKSLFELTDQVKKQMIEMVRDKWNISEEFEITTNVKKVFFETEASWEYMNDNNKD